MDSNKDEGVKCMAIGKAALEGGDRTRAVKFFTKAQRLYPNPQVDAFLSALYEGNGKQAADEKQPQSQSQPQQQAPSRSDSVDSTKSEDFTAAGIRQHNNGSGSLHRAGSSTASGAGADANAEQIEIVTRIKRSKKDYYQILGVTRECSDEDVRKAYRKISLKVHPDKNKAPGAEEAFKLVSRAFSTLSDTELREKYDRYGPEEDQQEQQQQHFMRRRRGNTNAGGGFYDDVFDANDVFNSFFFGGMQPQGAGFRRAHFTRGPGGGVGGGGGGGGRQENHSNNLLGLLQLLPILALFIFSYFPFSQPVYQLEKVEPYHYLHKTRYNAVNFYVKSPDFNTDYPVGSSSRRTVEAQVERDYREILVHNCRIEQSYYRWGQRRETPNCDKLQRFVRVS